MWGRVANEMEPWFVLKSEWRPVAPFTNMV